ncbi:MAG TPA: HD domain-containing phosphohydrolase [Gemmataceae bacterium]|nr:HD domain-containing phosphohydrolase [Gemmataceae bacterium]
MKRTIRLRGMNGPLKGRTWESAELLRVGRLDTLEIVLDDNSVSRYHAEIRATERGWRVRDLGSTNGTRLNGVRLGNGQWPLRVRDLLQFGEVAVVVENMQDAAEGADAQPVDEMRVAGTARSTWSEAMEGLAFDSNRCPRAGEQLLALLRAGHHLVHIEKEEDLLNSILHDAVGVLDAQRGAIVLADGPEGKLKLKALVTGRNEPRATIAGRADPGGRFQFSQSLASRCVSRGESILCHRVDDDPELAVAKSIAEGTMASVLCVLLRTPRKRLGVVHLDRSPWQKPFTMDDLHLADALAANVSAGIECAQMVRKQRDLFLDTITILAQAVELRDEYTGGHTCRVTTYSVLLAEQLNLEAEQVDLIRIGTPLHDIGKIGIDDSILRKPDRLTPAEFEAMKLHTVKGAEIVATVPDLRPIIPIVRSHHERWDGKGYPDGLGGEAISPMARVVAVADAFDAMTSDRPYRKGMDAETAFAEVEKNAGRQFDPAAAHAFLAMRPAVLSELEAQARQPSPSKRARLLTGAAAG